MKAGSDMVVTMYYTLTDDAGETLDESREGPGMAYLHGHGHIISGLEKALEGQEVGFSAKVDLEAADAYGERNEEALFEVERSQFPPDAEVSPGMQVEGEGPQGRVPFHVIDVSDDMITLDGNHPLAGQNLHFDVEIIEVREATSQELEHGHVHAGGHNH